MYPPHNPAPTDKRDDANEIRQVRMTWLERWFIRQVAGIVLIILVRRLQRERDNGHLNEMQHVRLVNVMRRTFLEDEQA